MAANIYLLAINFLGLCAIALSQENAQTRIPDSLLDCYKNVSLYHREFRPPMTISTLIELVRKVEQYPGTNMDMRALAISILHRFRLDGIEMNNEVATSEGVIPFSVKGYQFFKHRILLRSFMQGSAVQFPNASLTSVEQCTMHFLISNSIDKGQRGDEGRVCNQISSYQDRSRAPRSVVPDSAFQSTAPDAASATSDASAPLPLPDMQVEMINPDTISALEQKGAMFLDDDNADGIQPVRPKPASRQQPSYIPFVPGSQPRNSNSLPESECPVENGAIYTPYGTVTAGTLLAGIAAGLQPGNVNAKYLNPKASRNIDVQNIWAATLAGDLAELTLLQGPKYQDAMKVGTRGGWNSTFLPRWYFNENDNQKNQDQMTDAEIRGGLDGLIIAKNIQAWNSKAQNRLKLSQVLDMYYSDRGVFSDTKYRACARKDVYVEVASTSDLELQTEGFALILDPQMINEAYLDEVTIKRLSQVAVGKLNSYIPSNLASTSCSDKYRSKLAAGVNVQPAIDLHVVLDTAWQYIDIQPLLSAIATKLEIGIYQSNITLISGKEKKTILNSTNTFVDFTTNFNASYYNTNNFQSGMDVPGALQTELRQMFEYKMEVDRQNNLAGGKPTVVLFIPYLGHSLSDYDYDIARDAIQYFREKIPDVKFMYLAQGSKDRYNNLVDDSTKDIFSLQMSSDAATLDLSVDPLVNRLKEVHRRIINPVCGSTWNTISYSSAGFNEYLQPKTVNYYRLHPNYFFATGYAKIRVQGYGNGDLKVCHSRYVEYPNNSTTGDITCVQVRSETVDIELNNPCDGYDFVSQCPALYIAVEDIGAGFVTLCSDDGCRYPDSIKYTISNEGLTCTGGIGRFLGSPSLIAFTTILIAAFKKLCASY